MHRAIAPLLVIVCAGNVAAQTASDPGLPGRPSLPSERLPSPGPGADAAQVDSLRPLLGTYALRGEVQASNGQQWALSSRVTLRRVGGVGGALELHRAWDIALPGGAQRRVEATTRDVRVDRPGVVEATLRLEQEWVTGLTGAIEVSGTTTKVTNELALELFVGSDQVSESVTNRTQRAPEHFWRRGSARGVKLAASDLAPAPAVTTLVSNGPPSERYDITFVPDGYTEADLPAFRAHVRASVAALKTTSPFKEYWRYINIHRVDVASQGGGIKGGRGGPTALGTNLPGSGPSYLRIPTGDDKKVKSAARRAPGADATVVLCQDLFRSVALDGYTLVSSWEDRYPRTVVHELGHVIGKLLDEYEEDDRSKWDFISANNWAEGLQRWQGWGANVTTHRSRDEVPWRRWIPVGTPLPTRVGSGHAVGLYQGALHMSRCWHRPSETCCMRDSKLPFCVVCREQLVLSLSVKTFPIQVQKERVNQDTWRITLHHSIPGRPRLIWKRSAGFTVGEGPVFLATREDSPWDEAPLWCEVEDTTDFVRNDPQEKTVFVVHFVVRKGFAWDKGLELRGPWRAPAPGE